ncbi:MAG: HEAT repeat domain-containing protein [Pseudomonadota bacterium]|nr:HEAT repeat domain-containing protein [Pseudomonadota bacterium]
MRPSVVVVSLTMLAACGGLAYLHAAREQSAGQAAGVSQPMRRDTPAAEPSVQAAAPANAVGASTDTAAPALPSSGAATSSVPAATPKTIEQWIEDTRSTDPKVRAAAIAALANAPTAQALPALERVLETGEPNVDRHIALRSMHALALRDGDTNGQIRDVMRQAIYHGDDDAVTQTAQSLIDDLEAEFSERTQSAR